MYEPRNSKIGMYTLYILSITTDNVFTKISYIENWFRLSRVYVFLRNIQNE